ncbi:MAG: hypothetical protein SPL21_12025 [Fibrobacter sp.]|nr:hypothetical protein [Fibrobacter sp.]
MNKMLVSVLTAVFGPTIRFFANVVRECYKGLITFFSAPLANIIKLLKSILSGSVVLGSWIVLFEEFGKKILGWLALITGVSSGALGAKQIFDFASAVINPQEQMLDWLAQAFASLPSLNDLIAQLDRILYNLTQPYFTPPITFTYLLQVTAIGECFNQYLQALISTLIFVFSMFIVRWAFANNFTFTKEVPRA